MERRTIGPSVQALALVAAVCLSACASGVRAEDRSGQRFELKRGDHICYLGNTLAERMQHDGHLETLIQSRFPGLQLTFRNLGFSGDELTQRIRSKGFGSPDEHLTRCRADVVFAFFGYNESFAGKEGLDKFRADLSGFIDHTQSQKYNGKSSPRVVVFSPIAHENLGDPNLPDGKANNARLALYTDAMREVARKKGAAFVDLFHTTQAAYAAHREPLTIDGVHLNSLGNRVVAEIVARELLTSRPASGNPDWRKLEPLRRAVLDKNFHWFNRYRTVDGYSIYGGRADLKFVNGQTNRVVMDREMEILDVMTANRDRRIWALAAGRDEPVDDSNTPPFIKVISNKPGPLPGGKHRFLDPEEAIEAMTLAEGMKVQLFASEKMFPELANPVQMAFDPKGRLWVAVMPSYPHWKPKERMDDKVLIFEDTDGDGRADKRTVFARGLHVPTGLELWNGGLLIGQQPDLVFLKDTDGDDVADVKIRMLHGIDSADTHHALNSFVLGPGGALYFQEGTFHHTQVETPWKPTVRSANAAVYRFEPRSRKFDVYVPYGFANPHGHVFDRWGVDFVTDGTGNVNYYGAAFSGRTRFPRKHPRVKPFFKQRTRPCPGTEILASRHFPERNWGTYLDANVIGFQGILQYKIEEDGSGFRAVEIEPIIQSTDPNFRPVDMEVGPDGALYFLDWQNPLIGHMQHNLRDPSRDRTHGRIYRIYCPDRPLLKPMQIADAPVMKLLDVLKEPEDRVRHRARIELSGRPTEEVVAALPKWIDSLDSGDPEYEHHMLEALWVYQHHNVVNESLLKRMLRSPSHEARAAATRVLCYWRDRLASPLDLLQVQVNDEHPRVRLEAVRACSFFDDAKAAEVALESLAHSVDYYLDYTLRETMETLRPQWREAILKGQPFAVKNPKGLLYVLDEIPTADVARLPRNEVVCQALLTREKVLPDVRKEAVIELARLRGTTPINELVAVMEELDQSKSMHAMHVLRDLGQLLTQLPLDDVEKGLPRFERLARTAKQAGTRQVAWMMIVLARQAFAPAWQLAANDAQTLEDLLRAVPLIPDAALRSKAWPIVAPLLHELPASVKSRAEGGRDVVGRYVRIELPGAKRTLTLAEVEVFSGGANVARQGKAKQSSTAHGGVATRAIDGNRSGRYGDKGQTHTREGTSNPWWEVDLGRELPVEAIVIYNRTENGRLAKRLDRFRLAVLDSGRRIVFRKEGLPAPMQPLKIDTGASVERRVREAVIEAVSYIPDHEREAFRALAPFIVEGKLRHAAVRAVQRLDRSAWDESLVRPVLGALMAYVERTPPKRRTEPAVLDALQLAKDLTAALPEAEALALRKKLGELGVTVVLIRPVPHQMLYDRTTFYVEAGKPVELAFENIDVMPHNLLVVKPGMLEKVGMQAELFQTQPDAQARGFVPPMPEVLFHTRLLQPRESERLRFIAPATPGEYPYLCTFPGHWRRMNGVMHVVKDLESVPWELRNPPKVKVAEGTRPFVRQWKLADLAPKFDAVRTGRDFARAKKVFTEAACVQCHRMNGEGGQVGPDLADVKKKIAKGEMKATDVLREMLEPSFKINDEYRTHVVLTLDGKVYSGIISKKTDDSITLVDNPLQKGEPRVVKLDDIEDEKTTNISLMPEGLLNTFDEDEILDLVAFILSAGDPKDPRFEGDSGK